MLKYVFNQMQMECVNHMIGEKNDISILNHYGERELSEENRTFFFDRGIVSADGTIQKNISEAFAILSQPEAATKLMFTSGAGKYEHALCYDKSLQKHISFTITPDYYSIDDETDTKDILNIVEEFVGKSSMRSVSLSLKLSDTEALVLSALLDMERRSILRAFVDELTYTNNRYGFNMIWRMVQSSNASIQWFVFCFSEVIGERITLKQEQLQKVLEQLTEKGLIIEKEGQYQLSEVLCQLANRMIVVDNVLSIETVGTNQENERVSAGFTCMQSGIHDLLFIDYNGSEVLLKTVSSSVILEYMDRLLNMEGFIGRK